MSTLTGISFDELVEFASESDLSVGATEHVAAPPMAHPRPIDRKMPKEPRIGRVRRLGPFTSWKAFWASIAVKIAGWTVLVAGTGALVFLAFTRY